MQIATKLPFDTFLINKFKCREGISELFEIETELYVEEDNDDQFKFTQINVDDVLGQRASILITQEDDAKRYFTGIFNTFSLIARNGYYSVYKATIVPNIWRMTKNFRSRIFQQMTVPEIIRSVLEGFDFRMGLTGSYQKRNYCVQYQETDFDFLSRLMEEEGIFFYFNHGKDGEQVVFKDDYTSPSDCPSKSSLGVVKTRLRDTAWESSIIDFDLDYELSNGRWEVRDYNFQLPNSTLDAVAKSIKNIGGSHQMEVYEYPGGYAQRYDGIDKGGGEQSGELGELFRDNRKTADLMCLATDVSHRTITGQSDCCTLTSGFKFKMENHPNAELNHPYIVTQIEHRADQYPSYYMGDEEKRQDYSNDFTCIPHGSGYPQYRTTKTTPKPVINGPQTAFVVGPSGEEIFTDKYGRVKAQFHWDREGQMDGSSSCWMRVSQGWASNKWGSIFIPRVGMEVIVEFIGGDPDRPIITGCVYNPETMPPYELPENKTRPSIKSNTTPGGGGFNEIRFEDKAGEEQVFMHAQKDMDIRVLNDEKEIVLNDRHLIVENNQMESVKRDKSLLVGGDRKEEVTGNLSLKVKRDLNEKIEFNSAHEAGMAVHIKAGMSVVIEAGASVTLKSGGSFINVTSGGIFISGTTVMINSGGAAGSGAGVRIDPPVQPTEADTDQAGRDVRRKERPAPAESTTPTPLANALWKAASSGSPFVG